MADALYAVKKKKLKTITRVTTFGIKKREIWEVNIFMQRGEGKADSIKTESAIRQSIP